MSLVSTSYSEEHSILESIKYKFDRMLLVWCLSEISAEDIPKLLSCHKGATNVRRKKLPISVNENKDAGVMLKFASLEDTTAAQRILDKYPKCLKALPMVDLLLSIARIEVSIQNTRSSTLIITSKKKQKKPMETKALEYFIRQYGKAKSIQYIKKGSDAPLTVMVKYANATHGFLAMAALDKTYLGRMGCLSAKLKVTGKNKIIIPHIESHIRAFVKL